MSMQYRLSMGEQVKQAFLVSGPVGISNISFSFRATIPLGSCAFCVLISRDSIGLGYGYR